MIRLFLLELDVNSSSEFVRFLPNNVIADRSFYVVYFVMVSNTFVQILSTFTTIILLNFSFTVWSSGFNTFKIIHVLLFECHLDHMNTMYPLFYFLFRFTSSCTFLRTLSPVPPEFVSSLPVAQSRTERRGISKTFNKIHLL